MNGSDVFSRMSEKDHPGRLVDELIGVARDVENGREGMPSTHSERLITVIDTLLYFSLQKGMTESGEETTTALSGLIAELMHLARHVGISDSEFAALVATEQAQLNGEKG